MRRSVGLFAVLMCAGCPGSGGGDGGSDAAADTSDPGAITVSVVMGPPPLMPASGVAVRVENAGGASVEAVTDATGRAVLRIDGMQGPWDITAARAGYAATSLLGAPGTVAGAIRIDALTPALNLNMVAITGSVTGKADPNDEVQVDAIDFVTIRTRMDAYSTMYLTGYSTDPIALAALEFNRGGDLVNGVLMPAIARDSSPLTANVALPSPARIVRQTTTTIAFPSSGLFNGVGRLSFPPNVQQVSAMFESAFVVVGNAIPGAPQGTSLPVRIQSFDGDLAPNATFMSVLAPSAMFVANIVLHEVATDHSLTVGEVRALRQAGTDLATATFTSDATGYDTTMFTVNPPGAPQPSWRCYTANGSNANARGLPHLPSSVHLADIGLAGTRGETLALLVHMNAGSGAAWTTRPYNSALRDYEVTVGGQATQITLTGR